MPISLAPAASINFRMTFEPISPGKTSALLEIVSSARATQFYTLTGVGKEPLAALQLSPSSLDFGSQKLNSLNTKIIKVLNVGDTPLTISGVTVMGSGFGFSKVSPGLTLAPKQQAMFQVSFHPLSNAVASGKITILSKDLASETTVPLAGIGVGASTTARSTSAASAVLAVGTSPATSQSVTTAAFSVPTSAASTLHPALASSASPQTVHLQWGPSSTPDVGYRLYRGSVSGGPYTAYTAAPISVLAYDDTGVVAGATYYYVVTSVDSNGLESQFSNEARASVPTPTSSSPGASPSPSPGAPPAPSPAPSGPSSLTTGIAMNGSAALNGTRLRLTSASGNLSGSGWFTTPVNIQTFSNDFTFQIANPTTNPIGNGITFVIQNTGTQALGPSGGGLGYGPDNISNPSGSSQSPIVKSVAIKFDTVNNAGEGTNSTGLYTDGASPTMPAVTVGNGVDLRSGDIMQAHLSYDGTTLTLTLTDTVNTAQSFTTSWTIDIPGTVGGNTAYVGFTGATGYSVANQDIISWSYSNTTTQSNPPTATKTPIVYQSTTLPEVSSGPTFRTFAYNGFPDSTGTILDATAANDNVTFTINVPAAGTYDIKLSYKQYFTRGISQLTINGGSVGAPLDQYLPSDGYATFDYGNFTFPSPGNYAFKFTILGKDVNSSGYSVSFDDFTLTPQ